MTAALLSTVLLTLAQIQQIQSTDYLWHDNLGALNGMDQSGKVALSCGVIVFNPCPDPTITINCCVVMGSGGSTWIANPVKTLGYHHITLHFGMNIDGLTSNQYCTIYYSIDDTVNWVQLKAYDTGKTFFTSIQLPNNASDNSLGIRIMFEMEDGSNDHCYLNDAYLYGTPITMDPTYSPSDSPTTAPTQSPFVPGEPTTSPTKATVNPTTNPSTDPTVNPTTNPTINPTANPTIDPTVNPTIDPTINPTINPTVYPTIDPTANPTINPTVFPTFDPTANPTANPTFDPTVNPTLSPSDPTSDPTANPTIDPTVNPTMIPIFVFTTTSNDNGNIEYAEWINMQYVALCIIMMVCIGILIVLTIYKFSTSEGLLIMKRIRTVALFQMIGYFGSYFFWMICIIILYNNNNDHLSVEYVIAAVFQYLFWIIGWTLFYILLVFKLYLTFRESHYKMSRKCINFHVCITIFIPIWYSFTFVSGEESSVNVYFSLSAIGSILISFGMLILMISFNRNLFVLIAVQHKNNIFSSNIVTHNNNYNKSDAYISHYDDDDDDEKNDDNLSLNEPQSIMLEVVTKQTLLGSVMLFGGILYLFMILFLSILNSKEKTSTEWIIYEWVLGFSININLLSIYFGWKMNNKEYKLFCGKSHSLLILCCQWFVNNRMRKRRKNINMIYNTDSDLVSSLTLN